MKSIIEALNKHLSDSIKAKQDFLVDSHQHQIFAGAVQLVIDSYRQGGRLYLAGNGGSAADAQHLAAEFVGRLARDRAPLPAEALTVDSSILTAIGNDYGYEHVFSRQIQAKMSQRDVFLALTTSGQSRNILVALEMCRSLGIKSILFTGFEGGSAKDLADFPIVVPGKDTSLIQELHAVLYHTLCGSVEAAIFSKLNEQPHYSSRITRVEVGDGEELL